MGRGERERERVGVKRHLSASLLSIEHRVLGCDMQVRQRRNCQAVREAVCMT